MAKGLKVIMITLLVNAIIFIGIPFGYIVYQSSQMNFTSEKWRENERKRVEIVDDLLNRHELKGMNINDVIKLLGRPTENAYFKESDNIVYYLGNERGFISIDSEWLVISFNSRNKVSKYEVTTD